MTDIIGYKPVRQRVTTMKAAVDRATVGEPPESELRVYEFGNGTKSKKDRQYRGTFNESTGEWEN